MQTQSPLGIRDINKSRVKCSDKGSTTTNDDIVGIRGNALQSSTQTHSYADMDCSQPQSQAFNTSLQRFAQPSMVTYVSPGVQINKLSLAEMESIILPLTKRRSENFVLQEVMLLIKEIGKRSHIILSRNPLDRKLKKKAWEEVANSMALKRPHEPRRTGEQVGSIHLTLIPANPI